MAFLDYLQFENPEATALAIGLLIFAIAFSVLIKFMNQRGPTVVISFAIAVIASWKLYNERYYGWESSLGIVLIIAVIALFLRIIWSFIKFNKGSFRR